MPGPIADLIFESVREKDKEQFRNKMHKQEEELEKKRMENGEMTRDMTMKADKEQAQQWYLDYEERKIGPEEKPPEEKPPANEDEGMSNFLKKINENF